MKVFFSFEKELWEKKINVNLQLNRFERVVDSPVVDIGSGENPDNHRATNASVFHNGQHLMMWYTGMYRNKESQGDVWKLAPSHSLCVAYSNDGLRWSKPKNNIFLKDLYLAGVEYLEDEKQYVMALHYPRGIDKEEGQTTFCIGRSDDGLVWSHNRKPATKIQHFESWSGPKRIGERYWVIGQGISPFFHMPDGSVCNRIMFGFHSKDLKMWNLYPYPLFHYPIHKRFPLSSLQVHGGATVWPRGRINIGLVGQFWPAGFSENVKSSIGLIYSYDGMTWKEPFYEECVLSPRKNAWDNGSVMQGNTLYNFGNKTYHWYSGGDKKGNTWKTKVRIGLAAIRRDGFSYHWGEGIAPRMVLSTPFGISDKDEFLYINGKGSVKYPITVEILDRHCRRLPSKIGILRQDSVMQKLVDIRTIRGMADKIRVKISWKGDKETNRFYGFCIGGDLGEDKYLNRWRQV